MAFRAEAEKLGLEIQPVTGERLQQLVDRMFDEPHPVVEAAREAIESHC
jgi:hypothetical protein